MEFGICHLNCIAIRKEPSDQSEMVSQLLFGEVFQVIFENSDWLKIHMDYDFYEGWVLKKQVYPLDKDRFKRISESEKHFSNEMATYINDQKDQLQILTLGAVLPEFESGQFVMNEQKLEFEGEVIHGRKPKSSLVLTAYKFLNSPFLWGGRTPLGVDCSGFTQMVYRINGYQLFRDAHQQASQGEVLSFIEECEPGDLAFFDNEEGEIIHCGILLANNYIIHCHGKVRIDRIDSSGIYNVDTKRHTHKLRVMKQIF
ncbi:C40 family peptidase [Lutimonas saemankumensis]|uniref:C40 family peptidase n=1 Tax=Lutimonas saemankumensis TaxID=483016 RepID=UPI001CD21C40|nr:C40 family peptidase [Lutimonas saemankumensis]MCA0931623.1 C40 family peptidase [Lutimonas saemankumensis]